MSARTSRLAVLASGGGSNVGALFAHFAALGERCRAEIVLVISDKAQAGALARARALGVPAEVLAAPADASALDRLLAEHRVDLIVLAGYLKLVPPAVTRRWRGRMLNVHPALLPAFGGAKMYGRRVHQAVLDSGARVSGPTVHFVDEEYDAGPIIAQWPVPVFDEDTADTLAERVLRVEHLLYPRVVHAVADGAIALDDDGRVRGAFLAGRHADAFTLLDDLADLPGVLDSAVG